MVTGGADTEIELRNYDSMVLVNTAKRKMFLITLLNITNSIT
jgi:hypothetical protein